MQRHAFYRRILHERSSPVGLSGGPFWWISLPGLSRGHASVSTPKSVSAQEPMSPTSVPEPPSSTSASVPTPEHFLSRVTTLF